MKTVYIRGGKGNKRAQALKSELARRGIRAGIVGVDDDFDDLIVRIEVGHGKFKIANPSLLENGKENKGGRPKRRRYIYAWHD